jgi:predicted MPP superfamily phosphohydrolase
MHAAARACVTRFWAALAFFHLVVASLAWWIARRQCARGDAAPRAWLIGLLRDGVLLVVAAAAAGAVASTWAPTPGFTMLRLWCQGLFGEGFALCAWLTACQARRRRWGRAALPALATGALLAVYVQAYHREPRQLRVSRHELRLAMPAGGARRLRILHLTDIQAATIGEHEERALRAGLVERPDLIVFTGDYVHERIGAATGARAAADFRALIQTSRLDAPLGVYATEGDAGFDCHTMFSGLPVRCLVDACIAIGGVDGARVALAGLASGTSRGRLADRTTTIAASCPPADVTLVMGHRPDFVANLVGNGHVSLALAGHTHGGQVVVPLFGPPLTLSRLPRRFAADLNDYEGVPLHVSRGVGMERGTAPQIRFLCPPEICVIDVWY